MNIYRINDLTLSECQHLNRFYGVDITLHNGLIILTQNQKGKE